MHIKLWGIGVVALIVALVGCKAPQTIDSASQPAKQVGGPAAKTAATGPDAESGTADGLVEVVAYYPDNEGHAKIKALIEGLNTKYPGKVKAEFVDFTSDEGFKRWQAAGLSCGCILVNGTETHTYDKDGTPSEVSFIRAEGGEWTEAELYAVLDKLTSSSNETTTQTSDEKTTEKKTPEGKQ